MVDGVVNGKQNGWKKCLKVWQRGPISRKLSVFNCRFILETRVNRLWGTNSCGWWKKEKEKQKTKRERGKKKHQKKQSWVVKERDMHFSFADKASRDRERERISRVCKSRPRWVRTCTREEALGIWNLGNTCYLSACMFETFCGVWAEEYEAGQASDVWSVCHAWLRC